MEILVSILIVLFCGLLGGYFCSQHAISFKKIGNYKNTGWAFQQECRFVMYALPLS